MSKVLLLDDNADLVNLYKDQIEKSDSRFEVTVEVDSSRAYTLAVNELFDFLVIDAKLYYKGNDIGGLRLASDLLPRYGINSILVVSRFITKSDMIEYESDLEFLQKPRPNDGRKLGGEIVSKLSAMRQKHYAFVAMPFMDRYNRIFREIQHGLELSSLKCVRADLHAHTKNLHEKMFDLISKSKLVVFVAHGQNPNAFYEAGFADALGKELIIISSREEKTVFDINNRYTIHSDLNAKMLCQDVFNLIQSIQKGDKGPLPSR